MRQFSLFALGLAAALASSAQHTASLKLVGTYDTGLGPDGSEIISVREKDAIGALTNVAGSVDILDLSDPARIRRIRRVAIPACGAPHSVALHPQQDYFLAVCGKPAQAAKPVFGKIAAYRISDGSLLAASEAGIQPDSVAISPDGRYAVVANEAEGAGPGDHGGPGSLSLVDLRAFQKNKFSKLPVTSIPVALPPGLPGVSTGRLDDLARVAIDHSPGTVEPESVSFSEDSRLAFVTLQENNAVAVLNLATRALRYFGLGSTTHAADISPSGGYQPTDSMTAFRESDGIVVFRGRDGVRYFATADEGDTRPAPGGSALRGGRTASIFRADTGAFVADTGNQFDAIAAAHGRHDDSRSDRGGAEPEMLDVRTFQGRVLLAVSLERASAIALVDITDVQKPQTIALGIPGDSLRISPEGVRFFERGGKLYVLSANELAGTVSAYEVVLSAGPGAPHPHTTAK